MNPIVDQYHFLVEKLEPHITDPLYLRAVATLYTVSATDDYERSIQVADLIYNDVQILDPLRIDSRYMFAAHLCICYKQPEQKMAELFSLYNDMKKENFQPGIFTYILALIALQNSDTSLSDLFTKTKQVYEQMEHSHPFLTTTYAYPAAMLIALNNKRKVAEAKGLYRLLNDSGFKKGKDLQLLTYILLTNDKQNTHQLVDEASAMLQSLKSYRLDQKKNYPLIGLLTLVPTDRLYLDDIFYTYDRLNLNKSFKELNFICSVFLYVGHHVMDYKLLAPFIFIVVEKLVLDREGFSMITILQAFFK